MLGPPVGQTIRKQISKTKSCSLLTLQIYATCSAAAAALDKHNSCPVVDEVAFFIPVLFLYSLLYLIVRFISTPEAAGSFGGGRKNNQVRNNQREVNALLAEISAKSRALTFLFDRNGRHFRSVSLLDSGLGRLLSMHFPCSIKDKFLGPVLLDH